MRMVWELLALAPPVQLVQLVLGQDGHPDFDGLGRHPSTSAPPSFLNLTGLAEERLMLHVTSA